MLALRQKTFRRAIYISVIITHTLSESIPQMELGGIRGVYLDVELSINSRFIDNRGKHAMPRLSMNELTTYRWSFDEDIFEYERAGYKAIGLWRRKLADFGEERAIDLLAESELAVSTLFFAGGFTGSDGRTLYEGIEDAADALRLAAALNAGSLILFTGGRNNHTFRHADRLLQTALDELLPLAEDYGVDLALKPKHPACASDWSFLTSLPATLGVVQEYATPRLKIVYDTYHFPRAGQSKDFLAELVPHLALVHVADANVPRSSDEVQCPLGEGNMNVGGIVAALLEAGYDGDFEVRLRGPEIVCGRYHEIVERSQQMMSGYLSMMAQAHLAGDSVVDFA